MNEVTIEERLIHRIPVREWGLPSMLVPGKMWRSEVNGTITCLTASHLPDKVNIETLTLRVVPAGTMSLMPESWRAALWEYVQAWPDSGSGYGVFLAITEEQRCDFIRKWAQRLMLSDNIGCRPIAHDIGEFAAYGYELPEPKEAES